MCFGIDRARGADATADIHGERTRGIEQAAGHVFLSHVHVPRPGILMSMIDHGLAKLMPLAMG